MKTKRIIKLIICAAVFCFIDGLFHCPVLGAMPRFMEWYDSVADARADMRGQCTICHVHKDGTGELTKFGDAFVANSFRFTPDLRQAYPGYFAGGEGARVEARGASFDAKEFFQTNCTVCHGKDGKGAQANAPDFTDVSWQQGKSAPQLIQTLENGKGVMPSWRGKLGSEEIKMLVRYVRTFAGSGNHQ